MNTGRRDMSRARGSVRIIGGRWRGTRLPVPDVAGLRPTSDRARETLFNWLQPVLPDARVLDLFAGSGALGLESLSRGAREALLVERDPLLLESLHATIERLRAGDEAKVLRADVLSFLRAPLQGRFDIVFVDPPFDDDLWDAVLALLTPWLADDAWLYLESPAAGSIGPGPGWRLHRESRSRDARHTLYRRAGKGAATLEEVSDDSATSTP
jgi:16S rRNA (guanine966-N2)-methyltransferase